jgi:predicted permease
MVSTSRDIMISTVLVIVFGLGGSVLAGIAAGFIFYRLRDQKRAHRTAYSDAGGLTRLNLDGLSE